MISLDPGLVTIIMLMGVILFVFTGYPIAFAMGGLALLMGLLLFGVPVFSLMYDRVFDIIGKFVYIAIPLFILMGMMLERTGIVDRMYQALYLWLGGFRGGLAIMTVVIGTILGACVGIVGASVTMLTLVALPSMIKRGYSKSLAAGSVCAAGTLGTLIPPSIVMVIYGPMAQVSVGKLFMGAFIPGLILSASYCSYIGIRSLLTPAIAPAIPAEERPGPFIKKTWMLIAAIAPTALIIMAVLGSIFLGVAPPTEAAGVGAFAAILLSIAYRKFSFRVLAEAALSTLRITSAIYLIAALSVAFVGVFMAAGGGDVIQGIILSVPFGRWGAFIAIQAIIFMLGFVLDIMGILFIMIPIIAPLVPLLGFDPVWFGMITMINFQAAYMSPPLAPTIFYFKSSLSHELGVTMGDIFRGITPFLILIIVVLCLCVIFPDLILWLPSRMVG